ncbi:hypothetical protein [Bartonella sp. HY406]|uniref:hypothetical protein n=1 Tax=Bartonella sp. HY406 TaxID=2979331 RepID=UPI0021C712BD|nr:hypothetical protein [Bartonella sp. HY406]UXN02616.1 hypothetical protein N6B01_09030 [Bartonella sp. HY406]
MFVLLWHAQLHLNLDKYKGGAHLCMQSPGVESHHMPVKAYIAPLPHDMGPAIQMTHEDHAKTPSYAGRARSLKDEYYGRQIAFLNKGQFTNAFILDAIISVGISKKYIGAVIQATKYLICLKLHGLVPN